MPYNNNSFNNDQERILREQATQKARATRDASIALQQEAYPFFIPLNNITVPANNVNLSQALTVGSDGDFLIHYITGDIEPSAGGLSTISVRITDQGRGNNITEGYVNANLFLSPGIRTNQLQMPWKFRYLVRATSTLQLDFLNIDVADRVINITFYGQKILRG